MILEDLVGLKLPDICLTGEKEPRKNPTEETCLDRESNSGPLCDSAHATACATAVDLLILYTNFSLERVFSLSLNYLLFPLPLGFFFKFNLYFSVDSIINKRRKVNKGTESLNYAFKTLLFKFLP